MRPRLFLCLIGISVASLVRTDVASNNTASRKVTVSCNVQSLIYIVLAIISISQGNIGLTVVIAEIWEQGNIAAVKSET